MSISECSTALEMLAAYRSGAVSPVEIVRAALDRLAQENPRLNAVYAVDEAGALAAARASEERWRHGAPCGLLDGVPTTAKDALPTRGYPAFRGAAVYNRSGAPSVDDAPAIARMKEHGAVILGKTTMPDFGLLASGYSSKHGVTRNPWSTAHNCGGSSSGAAVTVAAGISPLVTGTDIVGSIRIPAAFCGLVGLKPGRGRVPYYFPNSPSLVAGPMARTVADAALLMNVISQPDTRDFTALPHDNADYLLEIERSIPPSRIGVLERIGFGVEPASEVLDALRATAGLLEGEGHAPASVTTLFGAGADEPAETFYRVRVLTEMQRFSDEERRDSDVINNWVRGVEQFDAASLYHCEEAMLQLAEKAAALLNECDYLMLPTYPGTIFAAELPAPDPVNLFAPWCNTFLFNLADLPAVSIPMGFSSTGLPIGLQIVGRRFDEAGLLRIARLLERSMPLSRQWPFQAASKSSGATDREHKKKPAWRMS